MVTQSQLRSLSRQQIRGIVGQEQETQNLEEQKQFEEEQRLVQEQQHIEDVRTQAYGLINRLASGGSVSRAGTSDEVWGEFQKLYSKPEIRKAISTSQQKISDPYRYFMPKAVEKIEAQFIEQQKISLEPSQARVPEQIQVAKVTYDKGFKEDVIRLPKKDYSKYYDILPVNRQIKYDKSGNPIYTTSREIPQEIKTYQGDIFLKTSQGERILVDQNVNFYPNINIRERNKKLDELNQLKVKENLGYSYIDKSGRGYEVNPEGVRTEISPIKQMNIDVRTGKTYGTVTPTESTISRLKRYYKPEGEKLSIGTILSAPKRTLNLLSGELQRAQDIQQQKSREFYQSQASIRAVGEAPNVVYFTPAYSVLTVSGGAEKLTTTTGQKVIQQNILGYQEKGYGKTVSNILGYGAPIVETIGGLLGLRSQGKAYLEQRRIEGVRNLASEMLSKQDIALSKNLQERLTRLKELDKGASKLGLKVPSAYEEAVNVGKMEYLGTGKQVLTRTDITLLTKTAQEIGIVKTTKEGKKVIEDIGTYKLPYKVVPPKEITLYKGELLDIPKQIELTPLKYTTRFTQEGEVIGASSFIKQGKKTLGVGFTGEAGKTEKIVNKNLFIYQQTGKIGRFDIITTGRKSTRNIPTQAGNLKLEIYPFGRRIETQLVRSKLLGQQKIEGETIRVYESEYSLVPTKVKRIYRIETPSSLGITPTIKQFKESFKLSKDITVDVITKKPTILSYSAEGNIEGVGKDIAGTYKEVRKVSLPYTQRAVSVRLPKGVDITKTGDYSNLILTSGKKSSSQYLKSLYQPTTILPKVERTIKIVKPSTKTITTSLEVPTETNIIYPSIYAGTGQYERYAPSQNIFVTTIKPTVVETLGEGNIPSLTGMGIKGFGTTGRYEDLGIMGSGRLGNLEIQKEKIKVSEQNKNAQKLVSLTGLDFGLKPSERLNEIIKQQEKLKQEQRLIQQPRLKQEQLQKLAQILKIQQRFRQPPRTPTTPPPKIPFIWIPTTESSAKQKVMDIAQGIEEFEVIGKRFGKEFSLGEFTSQSQAEIKLKGFLKGTLGRSGRILEEGKPLEFEKLKTFGYEFTPSKRDITRIVQRAKFSLSSYPERKEIQSFRKGGKSKRFKLI